MGSLQQEIEKILAKHEPNIIEMSDQIWEIAETRFQEHHSMEVLTTYLCKMGFHIEVNIGGLETAFVAKYGSTGPVIAILGEYDALPGLNQKPGSPSCEALVNGANGHGCGHNLLGTAGIAAVAIIKELIELGQIVGQIHYYGCPAEEGGSGKTFMVREGVFNNVDLALTWHPNSFTGIFNFSSLANYQVAFEFEGIASHAANSPDLGRSALDAVELMNVGVNYLREHIPSSAKLHYAITNSGGKSPNVVQAHAEVLYLIRGKNIKEVENIYQRVIKIAKGAALMTETNIKVKFDKACSNFIPNDTLNKVVFKYLQKIGLPSYSEEELIYAKEMAETLSANEVASAQKEVCQLAGSFEDLIIFDKMNSPFLEEIIPYEKSKLCMAGSTDVADVSWIVPTGQFFASCFVFGTPLHTWQLVSQGKTSIAHKGLLYAGKVLASSAIHLFQNPNLIEKAKNELLQQTQGNYINPIPLHIKPNLYGVSFI